MKTRYNCEKQSTGKEQKKNRNKIKANNKFTIKV